MVSPCERVRMTSSALHGAWRPRRPEARARVKRGERSGGERLSPGRLCFLESSLPRSLHRAHQVLPLHLRRLLAPVARGAALGEFEDGGRLPDLDPSRRHRRQAVQEGDVLAPDVLQPPVVEGEVGLAAVAVGPAGSGGGAGGAEGGGAGHGCEKKSVLCVLRRQQFLLSSVLPSRPSPLHSPRATRRGAILRPRPSLPVSSLHALYAASALQRVGQADLAAAEGRVHCGLCVSRGIPHSPGLEARVLLSHVSLTCGALTSTRERMAPCSVPRDGPGAGLSPPVSPHQCREKSPPLSSLPHDQWGDTCHAPASGQQPRSHT
jgi:hypothetical protein